MEDNDRISVPDSGLREVISRKEAGEAFDYARRRSFGEKFLEVFEGIGMCLSLVYEGAREQYRRWRHRT